MSCCAVKNQETLSSIKELNTLNKMFDEVILEEKEKYQLLTLRDKANKVNYDYIVWLELRIVNNTKNSYSTVSKQDNLKRVLEKLVLWIDLLKNFESTQKPKQLSLFGDEEEDEQLPLMPTGDYNWDKYSKECKRINIKNIKKKYTFFELFDSKYYLYKGIDYRKSLPSKEEVRELYKKAILDGKDKAGRYDWYWWDRPAYIADKDGLSNIELRDRLSSIRLFLVPYTDYFTAFIDDGFTDHSNEDKTPKILYRYYLNGSSLSICGAHDYETIDLPKYENLFDLEFLDWVRNTLDVPYNEVISDEDILKENIEHFFNRMLWYGKDEYDLQNKINNSTNWKQFKADILLFCKSRDIDANGGGSGYSIDGFHGNYILDKKGKITINQRLEDRIELNRDVDGLKRDDWRDNNYVVVYSLTGDEIYKKAFELFNKKEVANQVSLFDFMAA